MTSSAIGGRERNGGGRKTAGESKATANDIGKISLTSSIIKYY
jgi:hypothetical protein